MNIAVEDSIKLSKEDKKRLMDIGHVVYYSISDTKEQFYEKVRDCDVIMGNKLFYNELIPMLNVKLIAVWATGYDPYDISKLREHGVFLANVPGYSTDSVAEHIFAFVMEITKKLGKQQKSIRERGWRQGIDSLMEIKGKTLGIAGYGNIGKKVTRLGLAFDMEVLVHTRSEHENDMIEFTDKYDLLERSDFVALCLPLNEETRDFITISELDKMKSTAWIINTARGAIINESDLRYALKKKIIAGAALDVFEKEPLPRTSEILGMENVILTPHTAFYTDEALQRLSDVCINNIEEFFKGNRVNIVND